jgi:hypothetical protein
MPAAEASAGTAGGGEHRQTVLPLPVALSYFCSASPIIFSIVSLMLLTALAASFTS